MSNVGIVRSVATGVVISKINPNANEGDAFLDSWEKNLAPGLEMIRVPKVDIGASDTHCPSIKTIIAYVNPKGGPQLDMPKSVAIIGPDNVVVQIVMGCPVHIQEHWAPRVFGNDHIALDIQSRSVIKDDLYNPLADTFTRPLLDKLGAVVGTIDADSGAMTTLDGAAIELKEGVTLDAAIAIADTALAASKSING